jgi:hypothetical protein
MKLFEGIKNDLSPNARGTIDFMTMRVRQVNGQTVFEPYPACSGCTRATFEVSGAYPKMFIGSHAPVHPTGALDFSGIPNTVKPTTSTSKPATTGSKPNVDLPSGTATKPPAAGPKPTAEPKPEPTVPSEKSVAVPTPKSLPASAAKPEVMPGASNTSQAATTPLTAPPIVEEPSPKPKAQVAAPVVEEPSLKLGPKAVPEGVPGTKLPDTALDSTKAERKVLALGESDLLEGGAKPSLGAGRVGRIGGAALKGAAFAALDLVLLITQLIMEFVVIPALEKWKKKLEDEQRKRLQEKIQKKFEDFESRKISERCAIAR